MLKREMYLSRIRVFYDSNLIKILVGIRRCGKSVSTETLYMYLDALCKALMIKKIYRYDIQIKKSTFK